MTMPVAMWKGLAVLAISLLDKESFSPFEQFLKQLPVVAKSPLAFVAYVLVTAAWVLTYWLKGQPERKAEEILKQFADDKARLEALKQILKRDPPKGLTGNVAILRWVQQTSRGRSQMLLLIGWISTLVAIIVFAVAWRMTPTPGSRQITLNFHQKDTFGDCPDLGNNTRVKVLAGKTVVTEQPVVEGCKVAFTTDINDKREVTVSLVHAGPYSLSDPDRKLQMNLPSWDVYLGQTNRLRLSVFNFSGLCPNAAAAQRTFEDMLLTRAVNLRAFFKESDQRYNYLSGLRVQPVKSDFQKSVEEVMQWNEDSGSLQALTGSCFQQGDSELMQSRVYSGSLHGNLIEPIQAELVLQPDKFGETRDIHTASMLYTLAEEANNRKMDKDVVAGFLQQARENALSLNNKTGEQMVMAIDGELHRLGIGG
jgi:hypothetical protein